MKLITPDTIAFTAEITEAEIKERLALEMLENIGALDEGGKPHPGIEAKVLRGTGRKGGYTIHVTGPAPKRLSLPKPDES
jgi:hypothetical protein